jgi:hypothetical protein
LLGFIEINNSMHPICCLLPDEIFGMISTQALAGGKPFWLIAESLELLMGNLRA